jgi:hypothetical protein
MNERESTAIRAYAPRFNTSIPNSQKSQGRLLDIMASRAVFKDQSAPCGAFTPESLQRQIERAQANPTPPWARKRTRKSAPRNPRLPTSASAVPVEWTKEDSARVVTAYGVCLEGPFHYPINLCEDGSVVTRDGEYLGTWIIDEHEHPSFTPDGASEPLLFHLVVGLLCMSIREWHETTNANA